MTVDTKGFILTNKKDVFKVYEVIRKALVQKMMDETGAENWLDLSYLKNGYSIPASQLYEFGLFTMDFKYKKEDRTLNVLLFCDNDYSEFRKGKKIILSLGCWGSSVPLMECALKALKEEFKCKAFIDEDDCDSVDWREIK